MILWVRNLSKAWQDQSVIYSTMDPGPWWGWNSWRWGGWFTGGYIETLALAAD